jgi:hypothetical protein
MDTLENAGESELDRAIARRLAKLRALPVDTTRLDKALRAQLPQPEARARGQGKSPLALLWLRPVRAIAASVAILAVIGAILLSSSGGPVLASPAQMAQVHEEMVQGRTPVMQVDSISEANKALSAQWLQLPALPAVPEDHVMACCMRSIKNKKVACVLLRNEGVPVTMTVANAADMQMPKAPRVFHGGIDYRVQSIGKLNMVMTERSGRWLCLIGELPPQRLMDLAANLRF